MNDINKTALWSFIDSDPADRNKYKNISYMCADFSYDLQRNASGAGLAIYVAMGRKPNGRAHAFNAALCNDDLVLIDPQNDGYVPDENYNQLFILHTFSSAQFGYMAALTHGEHPERLGV